MADTTADDNQQDSGGDTSVANKSEGTDDQSVADIEKSAVAGSLFSLISSVMTNFDSQAEATARSQEQLAFSIDRLTGELDKLLEDAPSPFIMQHAARISGVRSRVKSLNTVLKSIQRRIDNMDQIMSAGIVQGTVGESIIAQQQTS